jgi:hypothetical protein
MDKAQTTWRQKYERLVEELSTLGEHVEMEHRQRVVDSEPWSASDVYYISNDMQVVDNEEYAKKHWGDGRYFEVKKTEG